MRFAAVFGICVLFLAGSGINAGQAPEQTIYKGVVPPAPTKEVKAEYPPQAMADGNQGVVRLECVMAW